MFMSALCVIFLSVFISTTARDCTNLSCTRTYLKAVADSLTDINGFCQTTEVYIGCLFKQGCPITAEQEQSFIDQINKVMTTYNINCPFSTVEVIREAKMYNSVSNVCMNFWLLTLLGVLALVMKV